jgi:hypothetical protein
VDPQQSPAYGRIINRKATERLARLLDSGTAVGGRRADPGDRRSNHPRWMSA